MPNLYKFVFFASTKSLVLDLLFIFVFIGGCRKVHRDAMDRQPNIILILADDLGYGDPGCYGGTGIPTPNIDRLAGEGILFSDAHVTCPVCGPSRMGLLSGRYQQQFGCYWNEDLWMSNGWSLPDSLVLLTQIMKKAGYATGHIGKWNISPDSHPYVDEAYDIMLWKGAYYPDEDGIYPGVDGPNFRIEPHGWGPPRPDAEYLTDRLTRHAMEFIEKHQKQPFFLYLAYNAPHTPLQADIKYNETFKALKDEPNRIYAGMVSSLDENIGRLLKELEKLRLAENTLIVFTSDNGPAVGGKYIPGWKDDWPQTLLGSAGLLRGHKAQLFEGGHREPFIMRWPGVLPGGEKYSEPVSTLDLYPTFCAVAGMHIPDGMQLDGVDLMPFITGKSEKIPHDTLFWMDRNRGAVRAGNWKLIIGEDSTKMLFNLHDDLEEQLDLTDNFPEVANQLYFSWIKWNCKFPYPVSIRAN